MGLTEAEARERFDVVDIYAASFRLMKATLSGSAEKTMMKIVVDGVSDQVLCIFLAMRPVKWRNCWALP